MKYCGEVIIINIFSAVGQPKPHIIWIRNGAFLAGVSQSSVGQSILQVKVESNKDLGDYICLAQNSVGSVTSIATLSFDQTIEKVSKLIGIISWVINASNKHL